MQLKIYQDREDEGVIQFNNVLPLLKHVDIVYTKRVHPSSRRDFKYIDMQLDTVVEYYESYNHIVDRKVSDSYWFYRLLKVVADTGGMDLETYLIYVYDSIEHLSNLFKLNSVYRRDRSSNIILNSNHIFGGDTMVEVLMYNEPDLSMVMPNGFDDGIYVIDLVAIMKRWYDYEGDLKSFIRCVVFPSVIKDVFWYSFGKSVLTGNINYDDGVHHFVVGNIQRELERNITFLNDNYKSARFVEHVYDGVLFKKCDIPYHPNLFRVLMVFYNEVLVDIFKLIGKDKGRVNSSRLYNVKVMTRMVDFNHKNKELREVLGI